MTTDIEHELRELFRDKAGDAPVVVPSTAAAPRPVLRRARLHQVGTALGTAVLVFALVVGSVAGMGALLQGGDAVGGGDYEVFERTATIEALTVTSPSDWFLVNQWPASIRRVAGSGSSSKTCTVDTAGNQTCSGETEPVDAIHPSSSGLAMFQLSNVDFGLNTVACGQELPADAAVMYVALDDERAITGALDPSIGPWPIELGEPTAGGGPCGAGRYGSFSVHGEPFFAWVGLGPNAAPEDVAVVETAFASMSVDDGWKPSEPDHSTPAYVLAAGTSDDGQPWRLELRPSQRNVELTLMGISSLGELPGFSVPDTPIESCCGDEFTDPIFGAVTKEATGVELRPSDRSDPIPGAIVPLPPTLPYDFDVFFIEGTNGLVGDVVATGLSEPPPVSEPRAEVVELTGSYEGHDWTARFTGSFADGTACMRVLLGGEPLERMCPGPVEETLGGRLPYLSGWLTSFYVLAGAVPPEVEDIRFVSGNATVPSQLRCARGPLGWTDPDRKVCALALPSEGEGTLQYLDAAGMLVFEENIGLASAEPGTSNELPWSNENGSITATGSFEGVGWSLEVLFYQDGYRLEIDGRTEFEGVLPLDRPFMFATSPTGADADARSIALVLTPTEVKSVAVAPDGGGEPIEGKWVPGSTADGGEARLWVIELTGRGSGTLLLDDVGGGTVCWPTDCSG